MIQNQRLQMPPLGWRPAWVSGRNIHAMCTHQQQHCTALRARAAWSSATLRMMSVCCRPPPQEHKLRRPDHCCRQADYAAFAGLPATMIDALSTLALFGMDGEVQE